MTEVQVQGAVLVALLVALPLVSWGSTAEVTAATIAGAILLVLGFATLTALRFVDLADDDG